MIQARMDSLAEMVVAERKENKRLRALLKHADDVVIWEHTPARSGFQEEIEAALGIGTPEQSAPHITNGPTCHPDAFWNVLRGARLSGTDLAVCSTCGRPADTDR